MTKPTDAQIEAARNKLQDFHAIYGTIPDEAMSAALTAAGVGDDEPPDLNSVLLGFTNYVNNERVRSYNEGVDDTIERCVQVADDEPEAPGEMPQEFYLIPIEDAVRAAIRATKKSIAVAIRALKDKP